jgi:holliday junction DNA helicase RuvA
MIGFLKGVVTEIYIDNIIIDVSGVGYEVYLPQRLIGQMKIGEEYGVVIYTNVKEDQLSLFGFANQIDKKVFLDLLKVSGIGAKTALSILGNFDANQIQQAVYDEDAKLFQTISGIGKKASERIIIDLKGKYKDLDLTSVIDTGLGANLAMNDNCRDAISALENLGYTRSSVIKVVDKIKGKSNSLEELITLSLKELV